MGLKLEIQTHVVQAAHDLLQWIRDLNRIGLSSFHGSDYKKALKERRARALDAKAPGLALLLSELESAFSLTGWERESLIRLSCLHTLCYSITQHQTLHDESLNLLHQTIGNIHFDALSSECPAVGDHWIVLGWKFCSETRVKSCTTYFWGHKSKRLCSSNSYYSPKDKITNIYGPRGSIIKGDIRFLPGKNNYLGCVLNYKTTGKTALLSKVTYPAAMYTLFNHIISICPWIYEVPIILPASKLVFGNRGLGLSTKEGLYFPISERFKFQEHLSAIAGPDTIWSFGLFDGVYFNPISTGSHDRNNSLEPIIYG